MLLLFFFRVCLYSNDYELVHMVIVTSRLFTFRFLIAIQTTDQTWAEKLEFGRHCYCRCRSRISSTARKKNASKPNRNRSRRNKAQADKSIIATAYAIIHAVPQWFLFHLIRALFLCVCHFVHLFNSILDIHRLPWRQRAVK